MKKKAPDSQEIVISKNRFIFLYLIASTLCLFVSSPQSGLFNWYLSVFWSLYFPIAVLGFLKVLLSKKTIRSNFQEKTEKQIIFLIPTVCRKNTLPALFRVINSILEFAPRNLNNFRIEVVVEQTSEGTLELIKKFGCKKNIRITVVPENYTTPNKTGYKARATHYATERRRLLNENTKDTYVYHLDDDTHVGKDTISSIAEFIHNKHGEKYLAQGILTFPYQLSESWFCRKADGIRPIDDMTRFKLFTGDIGSPLAGLHGEHLLIRADIEDEIGWDFGPTLAEDAYFALCFAQKYPGKSASLNSYSYGASPSSLKDLIKQRRRWAAGILGVVADKRFSLKLKLPLLYTVSCWVMGPFQFVAVVLILSWAFGFNNTSPVALWIIFLWSFNLAYHVWQYIEGNKINASVSLRRGGRTHGMHKRAKAFSLAMIPLVYAITFVEGVSAFMGFVQFLKKDFRFDVIAKEL